MRTRVSWRDEMAVGAAREAGARHWRAIAGLALARRAALPVGVVAAVAFDAYQLATHATTVATWTVAGLVAVCLSLFVSLVLYGAIMRGTYVRVATVALAMVAVAALSLTVAALEVTSWGG